MNCLVVVSLLGFVAAFPQESNQPISLGLTWFKEAELAADFRHGRTLAALGCGNEVNECITCSHRTAAKCHSLWIQKPGVVQCIGQADVKRLDKAFQRASFKYHQAMERCLAGQDPPTNPDADTFRFKRYVEEIQEVGTGSSSSEEEEAMSCPARSNFEDANGCWGAMKEYQTRCRTKSLACPALVKCYGTGEGPREPGPDRDWFRAMQRLHQDKNRKVRRHLRKLHECLGEEHGSNEAHLWGPH